MDDSSLLNVARDLALQASQRIMSLLNRPIHQERKKDKSLVTDADLLADRILREGLAQAFPHHAILTEETGLFGKKDAHYVWLIDPLDGTKAFAKGIPGFAVMMGLLRSGRPELGIIVDPLENRTYEAIKGHGAFQTSRGKKTRLTVSSRKEWAEMRVVVSTGFPEKMRTELQKTLSGPWLPPINSVGIKTGLIVRQEADVYISHHPVHFWDTCAPQIILEEAGGIFSKTDGSPLTYDLDSDFAHDGLPLASNGGRHAELVKIGSRLF